MKPIVFSFIIACSYFLVGCDVQNKDSLVRYSSFCNKIWNDICSDVDALVA